MFIGTYTDSQGNEHANLYLDYEAFYNDTFSPLTENVYTIPLAVSGRTYSERKEHTRRLAILYSCIAPIMCPSWSELAIITSFFEKAGKRYGLMKEFRENLIV